MSLISTNQIQNIIYYGEEIDLVEFKKRSVSSCCIGDVNSNVMLAVMPIIAATGIKVTKVANRRDLWEDSLIRKLESISGFSSGLPKNMFLSQLRECGISVVGYDNCIVPEINQDSLNNRIVDLGNFLMCRELTKGAYNIVFNIAVGKEQPIKTFNEVLIFAEHIKKLGAKHNRNVIVFASNFSNMINTNYGNYLEMQEIIDILKGDVSDGPFYDLCICYASTIIANIYNIPNTISEQMVRNVLKEERAYDIFKSWISFQQGDLSAFNPVETLKYKMCVKSTSNGIIKSINIDKLKEITKKYTDVGIVFNKMIGDKFGTNDTLFTIYSKQGECLNEVVSAVKTILDLYYCISQERLKIKNKYNKLQNFSSLNKISFLCVGI